MKRQAKRTSSIIESLKGGDLRSIGRSNEVVKAVRESPELFGQLITGMKHADPVVRARCADAAEKASQANPQLLVRHRGVLLALLVSSRQQEVRWHIAQILPRVALSAPQRRKAIRVFRSWLAHDKSAIVRVCAMQALADFAAHDDRLRNSVTRDVKRAMTCGSPALKARGNRLLRELGT